MANHEPDKEMFDMFKGKIKDLSDALGHWQQKESAIHSLAEVNAKNSGAPPDQMDAHVYMHKKMIKKSMADQAKQVQAQNEQGQGGPGSIGAPAGRGVPTAQNHTGMPQSHVPMAGQAKNTGANGWEGLMKPSNVPPQAQQQQGAPQQSTGPTTPQQQPMPGMPTPPAPGGFTGPNTMRPMAQ